MDAKTECPTLATLAGQIAAKRDAGEPKDLVKSAMRAQMDAIIGNSKYIIEDQEDENVVLGMVDSIYASKDDPETTAQVVYMDCLRRSAGH
jgi:hypothetical protein